MSRAVEGVRTWLDMPLGFLSHKPNFGLDLGDIIGMNKNDYPIILHMLVDKMERDLEFEILRAIRKTEIIENDFIVSFVNGEQLTKPLFEEITTLKKI
jgi:hypothetical protein